MVFPKLVNWDAASPVSPAPFPTKVAVTTPPLVKMPEGNCANPKVPVNWDAFTLRFVRAEPSPAKTELVMNALVMAMPATTLVASAALPPLAEVRYPCASTKLVLAKPFVTAAVTNPFVDGITGVPTRLA